MQKKRIAVQESLTNVTQELENSGYEIVDTSSRNLQDVAAVVITGEDENVMNISRTQTEAPVINADGLTAEQVRSEIEKRTVRR